jgi:hypothetical protein
MKVQASTSLQNKKKRLKNRCACVKYPEILSVKHFLLGYFLPVMFKIWPDFVAKISSEYW